MTIRTNIIQRLRDGRQLARTAYKQQDVSKLGTLRAGNSGLMSADGDVTGSCHRVAHLRQLGIEIEVPDDSSLLMFQVGTANEDIVYQDLLHTAHESEVILREEEIPTQWYTVNKTLVTGRPDMVICRREADEKHGLLTTPILGLELKSVASVWTSRTVLFDNEPKLAHLAQAGHYMWQLGSIPFRLIYKQYANQAMPDFAHRFFPRKDAPGSEYIEYNDSGAPKCVRPFEIGYELQFLDGVLHYKREDVPDTWHESVVSTADIQRFYEFTSTMAADKKLGPKPITCGPDGEEKSYSNCGYCPLNPVCKKKKLKYDEWLEAVKHELHQVRQQEDTNPDWRPNK